MDMPAKNALSPNIAQAAIVAQFFRLMEGGYISPPQPTASEGRSLGDHRGTSRIWLLFTVALYSRSWRCCTCYSLHWYTAQVSVVLPSGYTVKPCGWLS